MPEDRYPPLAFDQGDRNLDSTLLACLLATKGVDLNDVSSGSAVLDAEIPVKLDYQVDLAERIRKEAGVKTAAVGLITDPLGVERILSNGRADLVLIGRELKRDPYWPIHAAAVLAKMAKIWSRLSTVKHGKDSSEDKLPRSRVSA